MRRLSFMLVIQMLCTTGCVEPEPPTMDTEADSPDPVEVESEGVMLPRPLPPNMLPCPPGWREVVPDEGTVPVCEPWPEDGEHACATDEAHFPGAPACELLGEPCLLEEWAEDLPASGVLYVRPGQLTDGDGSRSRPFGTVQRAMEQAVAGTIIALGKGTYREQIELRTDVILWGACVSETRISLIDPSDVPGVIRVTGKNTSIRNLQVVGGDIGVLIAGEASATISDVVVAQSRDYGVMAVDGSALMADRLVVRDTSPSTGEDDKGYGLYVASGALAQVTHGVFSNNYYSGIRIEGVGTRAILRDIHVAETRMPSSGHRGDGIDIRLGAHAELTRAVIERNYHSSVYVQHDDTRVILHHVVMRDNRQDVESGFGLRIASGATHVTADKVYIANNEYMGIAAQSATLHMTDVVVRDTKSRERDHNYGFGLLASFGSNVDITRGWFDGNQFAGIALIGLDTVLQLTDVTVQNTRRSGGEYGFGIVSLPNTEVLGQRVEFLHNGDVSVMAVGENAVIQLYDVLIRGSLARPESQDTNTGFGYGVGAYDGALVELTDFVVTESHLCGVQVAAGGKVALHDGEVTDNVIGVCLHLEDDDDSAVDELSCLTDGVIYRDNAKRLSINGPIPIPTY